MSTAMNWRETDISTIEKRRKYTVTVIGCGQEGLSAACLFANAGFKVISVDSNPYVISLIKRGKVACGDLQLAQLVRKHVKGGSITAASQAKEAASRSDVVVLSVPPSLDQKRKPDYTKIENACKQAGMGLQSGSIAIVGSMTGPGVTESLVKETLEKSSGLKAGIDFGLAYAPISSPLCHTFRDVATCSKVVGAINEQCLKITSLVLKHILNTEIAKVANMKTAEAVTLFAGVYSDVSHALTSELALFCEKEGIDFFEGLRVLEAQRFSNVPPPDVLSWYSVDSPYFLFEEADNINADLHLAAVARKINSEMVNHALRLTRDALGSCGKTLRRAKVLVFGVSSRADVREADQSFIKHLVAALGRSGARVLVYDPLFSYKQLKEHEYPAESTFRKSVEGADCLVFTAGGNRFRRASLNRLRVFVRKPAAIVDLANAFNSDEANKMGFIYRGFGKG